jgi:hypothetical protein
MSLWSELVHYAIFKYFLIIGGILDFQITGHEGICF